MNQGEKRGKGKKVNKIRETDFPVSRFAFLPLPIF
jgi:hypothetical protein